MSVRYIEDQKYWIVTYSKRNPMTGKSVNARRIVKQKSKIKAVERELIAQVERKIYETKFPNWKTCVLEYIESCRAKGLAPITIYNSEQCIKAATFEQWGSTLINEITTQQIRDLILINFKDNAPSHKQAMLKYIRAVFIFALENGYISRDPVPKMAFKTGDKIKKVLTEEHAKILLQQGKTLNWPWYPHVAMALYTGMRNGELYALTWDKVNFENRQILVDRAWVKKGGFKDTKSGDDRIVEIAAPLVPLLKELKLSMVDTHFVLPHMREWTQGEQARELRKFLFGIRLPEVRFHDLRATWATLMLSKNVAPAKVMMMGGWKDMKTMMIYIRKAGIAIKGITDCLNLHDHEASLGKVINFESKS
ncbi:MAG: tyrosine-type recombinase/integrase [Oligoflexales bacterium]